MINQRMLKRLLVISTLVVTLIASVPMLVLAMPQQSLDPNTNSMFPSQTRVRLSRSLLSSLAIIQLMLISSGG